MTAILEDSGEPTLPTAVKPVIEKMAVEILSLRPTMSYGLSPAAK